MKKIHLLLTTVLFLTITSSFSQTSTHQYINSLNPQINVSFVVHVLESPTSSIARLSTKTTPAASLIKIPILTAFLEKVEQGTLSMDDTHIIQEYEIVGGAGELQYQGPNQSVTLGFLAAEMIRTSDNTATNILISYLSMPWINQRIQKYGLQQTSLNRLMMDFQAIEDGRQNYTSAMDLVLLLEAVWNGEILNDESKVIFLNLLQNCEDKSLIAEAVPTYTSYNKTGTLDYVRGDAAILQSGNQTLIMSIIVEGFDELEHAEEIIRNIATQLEKEIRK